MKTFLIWVIGKDQYSEGLIYYLSKLPNVLVSTTNVEYVSEKVRILAPCDMNELEADAIILPYSNNVSLGKFGKVELGPDFFTKQRKALFFSSAISPYTKVFARKNNLTIIPLFELEETIKIKKEAVIDLIIQSVIENSKIMLQHIDFGVIKDENLTPTIIDVFNSMNLNYSIADKIDNLLDQNVIIVPEDSTINKNDLEKYQKYPFLIIKLYENNISFNVFEYGKSKKIYSLRTTSYALLSYTYSFSLGINNLLVNNQQN